MQNADRLNAASVDQAEIARFSAMADEWWDPNGKFKPLHRLGPARLSFIRRHLIAHFRRDAAALAPFGGLSALDVGCGGGLIAEPMARQGADVTGIDAAAASIGVAALHAERAGLALRYRVAAAEDLVAEGLRFDIVLALEIIEHVADVAAFLGAVAALVRPGGALVLSTLNRTPQAYALAIVGAEYILGWLPRGTHDWSKFVRPSELAACLRPHGVTVRALAGLEYSPWRDEWTVGRGLSVNYLAFATRAPAADGAGT
jgi:2-polyprenyl-6-hydroxyphenyl methylase/3-demethylubiquinone-9 3-methyltransferase